MAEKPTYEELEKRVIQLEKAELERKRAEEALRENEQKYRRLFELESDALFLIDNADGRILEVNRAASEMYGYTRKELLEFHNTDLSAEPESTTRATRDELSVVPVRYHQKKDGSVFAVEITASHLDWHGRKVHIAAIREIGWRLQAEEALKQSEKRLRSVLETVELIAISLDVHGNIIFCNDFMLHLTGWRRQEVLGKNWFETFIPPEIRDLTWRSVFLEILENGKFAAHHQNEIVTKSGQRRLINWSNTIFRDSQKNAIAVTSIGEDITEQRRSQDALRESEQRFRDLAEMLPEAVFEADRDMNLTFANRQAISMFGYSREDFENGLNGFDMLVLEDRQRAFENASIRFQSEDIRVNEYRGLRKDGSTFPVLMHTSPIINHGTAVGFRGIIVDITERKEIEGRLQQAQKMEAIGTFAGGIAHDFNNILHVIIGFTELALDKTSNNSQVHEDLQNLYSAGLRARDLVMQLLTFSRQTEQKMHPVQVNLIAKETLRFLRASLPSSIQIRSSISSDGKVFADPTQIQQVLMNLSANAMHAMRHAGGVLEVSLAEVHLDTNFTTAHPEAMAGPHLKLTVADNGEGMSEEMLGHIFAPFFTTKGKEEGTGLGLAVVHGIVKSCDGFIKVSSKPGQGSAFDVFLPLVEVRAKPRAEIEGPLPTGTERVLVVDDDKIVADICKQMLERLGYRVTTRTSSIEALELFRVKWDQFDLVITDLTMPNMNGDKLAMEMIELKPDIPIIICTGFSKKLSGERAEAMGIKGLLLKPVVRTDMAMMVRKVLDDLIEPI